MPQVPLYRDGEAPINSTGVRVPMTAQNVTAGPVLGQALVQVGGQMVDLAAHMRHADDTVGLLNAQGIMKQHAAEQQLFQQQTPDQNQWLPAWEKRQEQMQEQLGQIDLSGHARQTLDASAGFWSKGQQIDITGQAFKQSIGRAVTAVNTAAGQAANDGNDPGIYSAFKMLRVGAMTPEAEDAALKGHLDVSKAAQIGKATDAANAFVDQGNLPEAERVIQESRMSDDQKQIQLYKTRVYHAHVVETKQNKESAAFFSDINLQRANKQTFAPEQVNQWAKDGKISKERAAYLINQYENDTPAPAAQFNDFVNNRVLKYDPTKDTSGAEIESIQREGVAMGMDAIQAGRMTDNLNAIIKQNTTSAGRAESHVKSYGLDRINDLMKVGTFGKIEGSHPDIAHAIGALGDVEKMQQFGLTKDQAKQVAAVPGTQRLEMFQQLATSRYKTEAGIRKATFDAGEFNKLTPWTQDLLTRAAGGEIKATDKGIKEASDAAGQAAQIQDAFEAQFQQFKADKKRTPTNDEVQGMVDGLTGTASGSSGWDAFKALPPQASAGMPSLRGYAAVPDLAARLPDNLAQHADDFQEAAQKYNLDPLALAAISMHETGSGTSKAFKGKNNAMGVSNSHGPVAFEKVRDSIFQQAKTLAGPLYHGANTFDQVGRIYAPVGAENDPTKVNGYWPGGVAAHYAKLQRK
jgi:hypothetical protein